MDEERDLESGRVQEVVLALARLLARQIAREEFQKAQERNAHAIAQNVADSEHHHSGTEPDDEKD